MSQDLFEGVNILSLNACSVSCVFFFFFSVCFSPRICLFCDRYHIVGFRTSSLHSQGCGALGQNPAKRKGPLTTENPLYCLLVFLQSIFKSMMGILPPSLEFHLSKCILPFFRLPRIYYNVMLTPWIRRSGPIAPADRFLVWVISNGR